MRRNYNMINMRLLIMRRKRIIIIIIIINSYTFVTLIKSTYEELYAIYIEWTKLSEIENHLLSIQLLHAVETIIMRLCIKLVHVDHVRSQHRASYMSVI